MPAEVVGLVALDELVVHGWDIAVATGQPYEPPAHEIEAAMAFVTSFDAPRDGRLFGPIVPIPRRRHTARPAARPHRPRSLLATTSLRFGASPPLSPGA